MNSLLLMADGIYREADVSPEDEPDDGVRRTGRRTPDETWVRHCKPG